MCHSVCLLVCPPLVFLLLCLLVYVREEVSIPEELQQNMREQQRRPTTSSDHSENTHEEKDDTDGKMMKLTCAQGSDTSLIFIAMSLSCYMSISLFVLSPPSLVLLLFSSSCLIPLSSVTSFSLHLLYVALLPPLSSPVSFPSLSRGRGRRASERPARLRESLDSISGSPAAIQLRLLQLLTTLQRFERPPLLLTLPADLLTMTQDLSRLPPPPPSLSAAEEGEEEQTDSPMM